MLPVFEAVANSIHAIEEARLPAADGRITLDIQRSSQGTLGFGGSPKKPGPETKSDIVGFKITDNGVEV